MPPKAATMSGPGGSSIVFTSKETAIMIGVAVLIKDVPDIDYDALGSMVGHAYGRNARASVKKLFDRLRRAGPDMSAEDYAEEVEPPKKAKAKPANKPAAATKAKKRGISEGSEEDLAPAPKKGRGAPKGKTATKSAVSKPAVSVSSTPSREERASSRAMKATGTASATRNDKIFADSRRASDETKPKEENVEEYKKEEKAEADLSHTIISKSSNMRSLNSWTAPGVKFPADCFDKKKQNWPQIIPGGSLDPAAYALTHKGEADPVNWTAPLVGNEEAVPVPRLSLDQRLMQVHGQNIAYDIRDLRFAELRHLSLFDWLAHKAMHYPKTWYEAPYGFVEMKWSDPYTVISEFEHENKPDPYRFLFGTYSPFESFGPKASRVPAGRNIIFGITVKPGRLNVQDFS